MKHFNYHLLKVVYFATILFILLFTGCQQQVETVKKSEPWVGKWVLKSAVHEETGEVKADAIFHYYENGTFASQASFYDRPTLTSNPNTLEEYKSAFDSYRAGYGRYTINETKDTLTYEYSSNLRPHRIASPTSFYFEVIGDTMKIKLGKWSDVLIREL